MPDVFRWIRTVRHFPPGALWHRLRLKVKRLGAYPVSAPVSLAEEWRRCLQDSPASALPISWEQWQFRQNSAYRAQCRQQADDLLHHRRGILLNEPFDLFQQEADLLENLPSHTPLWQENYGYLEFLLPVILLLHASGADSEAGLGSQPDGIRWLGGQFELFWQLPFQQQTWSAYGISRRLLVYCGLIPLLPNFSTSFQEIFWSQFFAETAHLYAFLELDIRGNHLVKNYTALLVATSVLERIPSSREQARVWRKHVVSALPSLFQAQLLPDGIHYERTPMYHLWVLQDLLTCVSWLKTDDSACLQRLLPLATTMFQAAYRWRHSSNQLPLLGDSSQPQMPDLEGLQRYAVFMLPDEPPYQAVLHAMAPPPDTPLLHPFPQAGFAVFRHARLNASLVMDCGDFGPRALPAHSHCDLGHFEVHVDQTPIIVDSGVSDYTPSLLRDYFRGTAAHNTVWLPGEEQADIWGSFRVADYPDLQQREVEQDASGAKVTVRYENYNRHYQHQRSIYSVSGHFWVVQDWLPHVRPEGRECYSLLHIHPDCDIQLDGTLFTIHRQLLILPFGVRTVEWADYAPWRNHLNLYSDGFNQARPGKLIAVTPKLPDCFGWVLVPFQADDKPGCTSLGDGVQLELPGVGTYRLTWDSSGLHVAFLAPEAANR
jgi:hypothetical protein